MNGWGRGCTTLSDKPDRARERKSQGPFDADLDYDQAEWRDSANQYVPNIDLYG